MKRYYYFLSIVFAAFFTVKVSAQIEPQKAEISPLLKSQWGQDAPFYYSTPTINGQHCRTGCGATALSQVIYYHKQPVQPTPGIYSYETSRLGKISFDFSKATFDYDIMQDSYEKTDSEDSPAVKEVSELMFASGVVLNMDYDLTESSALFGSITTALSRWFNFPEDGMRQISRDYFTNDEWEEVIYEELKNNRPVLYLGGNGTSSHIFVCDGYKDGKFHMNWGWYGEKNGYFSLANLQTERVKYEGILSLNSGQKIIVGVRGIDDPLPAPIAFASSFNFNIDTGSFTISDLASSYNNTPIIPGLRLIKSDNSKEYVVWSDSEATINKSNSTISYSAVLNDIEDGNYIIRPVYKLMNDSSDKPNIYPVFCSIANTRYYTADITSNTITNPKEGTDIVVNVSVSEYTPASTFIKGENYGYGFTIFAENNGNTTITRIGVKFCDPETDEEKRSTNYTEILAPGESKTISLGIPYTADPGEYDMYIYDNTTKKNFCDPIRVIYHNNAKIVSAADSKYRYMPLSEDSDEAIILIPKTTTYVIDKEGEVEIESSVNINGKDYRISELGPRLLYGRADIMSLTIPSTVEKIHAGAFGNCSNISEIKVNAQTPPQLHSSAFDVSTIATATLKVPDGSVDLYKESPVWSEFNYASESEEDTPGSLSMTGFSIAPGDYFKAPINLDTNKIYYGCEFNLTVPDALNIAPNGVSVADGLNDKSFAVVAGAKNNNGSYKIVMYSSNNTPITAGNNPILNVNFLADDNFTGGTISITDILFSEAGSNKVFYDVPFEDTTCSVTVDVETLVESGIPDVMSADIYSISGVRIFSDVNPSEAISLLAPGVYIVKSKGNSYKVLKH